METTTTTIQLQPPAQRGPQAAATSAGAIDINPILAKVDQAMPRQFKKIYEKVIAKGLEIMSGQSTRGMMEEQLAKQEPMAKKIADGAVALYYILHQQSNKTLPPQIAVPVVFALTLYAFNFLQQSGDPEATKQVLGDAIEASTKTILAAYKIDPAKVEQIVAQQRGQVGAPDQQATGLLQSGGPPQ